MSASALHRRLKLIERAVNPPKRDTLRARVCVTRADESREHAIGRHRLEWGRAPVVMVPEKRA